MAKPRRDSTGEFKGEAVRRIAAEGEQAFLGQGHPPAVEEEARASLLELIEVLENRARRQSALGDKSAIEYERAG